MHFMYYCNFSLFFLTYILQDTSLNVAVKNGHTDIVRLLIENGADVNKGGGVGYKHKLHKYLETIVVFKKGLNLLRSANIANSLIF